MIRWLRYSLCFAPPSHNFAVRSQEARARRLPSGEKARPPRTPPIDLSLRFVKFWPADSPEAEAKSLLADDFCRIKAYSQDGEFANKMMQPARDISAVQFTIAEMVRRIVERFHPERIILFGSHARGTAGPHSDVDLLVVMQPHGSKRRRAVEIHGLLAGMGVPKDVIVVTPEEFEAYRDAPGTVIRTAWQEGKILHDRAA